MATKKPNPFAKAGPKKAMPAGKKPPMPFAAAKPKKAGKMC